jgi:Sulfotransferase family
MIDKNKKIIVLMPPKTASNSIRETLKDAGLAFSIPKKQILTPLIHLKLNEIVNIFEIENLLEYKIFQIVRCPYQRFISSYFHQLRILDGDKSVIFHDYDLLNFTKHLSNTIQSENFISSFYGNRKFVDDSINSGISWGGSRLFDTQKSWSNSNTNVTYFKLEDISNDFLPVNNFLKINSKFFYNINKSNLSHKYESLLTPQIKNIVSEIFHEDFDFFGYKK